MCGATVRLKEVGDESAALRLRPQPMTVTESTFNSQDVPSPNISVSVTSDLEENSKKRAFAAMDGAGDDALSSATTKRRRVSPEAGGNEDADCINDISEDEESPSARRTAPGPNATAVGGAKAVSALCPNQIVLSMPSNGPHALCGGEVAERGNNKNNLNLRAGQSSPFKANHQRRHRVKTGERSMAGPGGHAVDGRRGGNAQSADLSHPLVRNDPVLQALRDGHGGRGVGDRHCRHWMARGWCKFKDDSCPYRHPPRFEAKRFWCPEMRKQGECSRGTQCLFSHNRRDIPCRDHHGSGCQRRECPWSHQWTRQQFEEWVESKRMKQESWEQMRAEKDQRDSERKCKGNGYGAGGSAMTQNDDRLHAVQSNTNFTSALTE